MDIAPPSTPTGDALLASSYFQWGAQASIDIFPAPDLIPPGPRVLRRILADDRHALNAFRAARPETAKGKRLKRTATAAFRFLSAAAKQYLLYNRAAARGNIRAMDRYGEAGETLWDLAGRKFEAADNIGTLPYPY